MTEHSPFWILLAREGETTDGRYISAKTLIALANSYSPSTMPSLIRRGYSDELQQVIVGKIVAAKTEVENDEVSLYVQVEINEQWFDVATKEVLTQIAIYPCLEYVDILVVMDAPYISGVTLDSNPSIKNLEPLNKYMVKS